MIEMLNDKFDQNNELYFDIFDKQEIDKIHDISERYEYEKAQTGFGLSPTSMEGDEIRRSNVKWFHNNDETKWIYKKLETAIKLVNSNYYNFNLVGTEALQFTEYDSNHMGHYDFHVDMGPPFKFNNTIKDTAYIRKLSITIPLTEKSTYLGGDFLIKPNQTVFVTTQTVGRAIFFPSWVPHCVTPVYSGIRHSLVLWCYGEAFK
jgi:predicted 2-oxoglutarate/Fe(II)-dependent dioxygenase YbiX